MQTKIKNFIKLLKEKKEIAKEVKNNQEQIDWLEPEIRNYFGDHSIEKISQDGLTIFIKRQIFAEKCKVDDVSVTNEECIEALKQAHLDMYCEEKIKSQSLNSFFKELVEQGLPIPEALRGKFQSREVFRMGSRKS